MIRFRQYIPHTIAHLVKSIWYLQLVGEGQAYEEAIIPDGHHELIFYLDGGRSRRWARGWTEQPGALIASQTLESYRLQMPAGAKLYGIRFYPHTLYPLLGVPLHLLGAAVLPLGELLAARGFWDCIGEDVDETFRRLEAHLVTLFEHSGVGLPGYRYVEYSVRQMIATGGRVPIKTLIGKSGITAKYYDELFKKYVGITPKCLGSILQFNTFIDYRNRFPAKTLTECAYEAGYYDQSHLIKASYQWAGAPPREYFSSAAEISNLFAAL